MMDIKEILKELKEKEIKRHFLSLNEASKILGTHPDTIKEWINKKIILGANFYIHKKEKVKYVIPVWFLKEFLDDHDYKIYLENLKEFLNKKNKVKTLFLSTPEVAKLFGVSPNTVIRWIENKSIKAIKIYNPHKDRYRYFIPIWTIKDLFLSKEDYQEFVSLLEQELS